MTEQELRKLNRRDLLELLVSQGKERDALQAELEETKTALADRQLHIAEMGSIAEAALMVNGVFDTAQKAADQYLENIKQRSEQTDKHCAQLEQEARQKADQLLQEATLAARQLEEDTQRRCQKMEKDAKEKAEAQKKAEEDAVTARKNQEIQTRKNTFLSALRDVENLEYQSSEAESLVQNAISKLSLVETYEEAASYKERLQKAIDRIATLPTESEWQAAQQQKETAKAEAQAAEQEQIGIEQQSLKNYLNQAKRSWNTWSNQPPANPAAGPGSSSQSVIAAPTTGRND